MPIRTYDDRLGPRLLKAEIRKLGWHGLMRLYEAVEAGDTLGWPSGRAFEYLVLRAFELDGAEVEYPYRVTEGSETLEEIDGAFYLHGRAHLVESKDHGRDVQITPIAKLRNQLMRRPAGVVGIVVGRNGFTSPAKMLARYGGSQPVLLWEGAEIRWLIERHDAGAGDIRLFAEALELKYRYYVERAIPNLNVTEVMT